MDNILYPPGSIMTIGDEEFVYLGGLDETQEENEDIWLNGFLGIIHDSNARERIHDWGVELDRFMYGPTPPTAVPVQITVPEVDDPVPNLAATPNMVGVQWEVNVKQEAENCVSEWTGGKIENPFYGFPVLLRHNVLPAEVKTQVKMEVEEPVVDCKPQPFTTAQHQNALPAQAKAEVKMEVEELVVDCKPHFMTAEHLDSLPAQAKTEVKMEVEELVVDCKPQSPTTAQFLLAGRMTLGELLDSDFVAGSCGGKDESLEEEFTLKSLLKTNNDSLNLNKARFRSLKRKWKQVPKLNAKDKKQFKKFLADSKKAAAKLADVKVKVEDLPCAKTKRTGRPRTCKKEPETKKVKVEDAFDTKRTTTPRVRCKREPKVKVKVENPLAAKVKKTSAPRVRCKKEPCDVKVKVENLHNVKIEIAEEEPGYYSFEFIWEFGMKDKKRHIESGCPKPFHCPVPNCSKMYKNPNGLKYHARNGHCQKVVKSRKRANFHNEY